ncbi:T9SS type A sorting domain-containing protein, partial [Segetibacter aerophilus]|uniref:T9SS type A sorting domain-containing protein n=1 Tax=Segetibacter aerophilus TaxID=670293 RepID=UPI0011BF7168
PDGGMEAPIAGSHLSPFNYDISSNQAKMAEQAVARVLEDHLELSDPVEGGLSVIDIKAKKADKDVLVEFSTTKKINTDTYEVEKSADGRVFELKKEIRVIKNQVEGSYHFTDLNPNPGENYYRVRSTAHSGRITLSKVASVNNIAEIENVRVFPNPIISNKIYVQSYNLPGGTYVIKLLSSLGQAIYAQSITHSGGSFNHIISLKTELSKGPYLLHISGENRTLTRKLIK